MHPIAIEKSVQLDALPSDVWPYLAQPDKLSAWLNAQVAVQAQPGALYEERGQANGAAYVLRGRVLRALPPAELLLSYRVDTDDGSRWPVFTSVHFMLQPRPGGSALAVAHTGFENLPERYRDFTRKDFDFGWGAALERLQAVFGG